MIFCAAEVKCNVSHHIKPFPFNIVDVLWLAGIIAAWWAIETWVDRFPYPWPNIFGYLLIVMWVIHFVRRFYAWYKS